MKYGMVALALLGGIAVTVQAAANRRIQDVSTALTAAFLSHGVGAVVAALIILCNLLVTQGPARGIRLPGGAPWWAYTAGFWGVVIVVCVTTALQRISLTLAMATVVVGQLLLALLFDYYGWGLASPVTVDGRRIIGVGFVVLGVILIQK